MADVLKPEGYGYVEEECW